MAEDEAGRAPGDANLSHIISSLTDGILIVDPHGYVLFANPAAEQMFGYGAGKMLGLNLGSPVVEGEAEVEIPRPDGKALVAEIRAVRIEWMGEDAVLASFRDVTARREAERQILALSRELIEVQEAMQRRLGQELHDTLGQYLTGLRYTLYQLRDAPDDERRRVIDEIEAMSSQVLVQAQRLSRSLKPVLLESADLESALRDHIEHFTSQTGIEVRFEASGLDRRFGELAEISVFRIIQEALTNVARYAGVEEVEVSVRAIGEALHLQIEDKGKGFEPEAVSPRAIGIRGMRDRAELLGGEFTIESSPGNGVRIFAKLPMNTGPQRAGP